MPSKCIKRIVMVTVLTGILLGTAGCPLALYPLLQFYVRIPDPNLDAAVREELSQPLGFLTTADLLKLRHLDARNRSVSTIRGLEYCTNLTWLDLDTNSLSNISSLSNLTNLTYLNLDSNAVSDIQPLAGLLNLNGLSLFDNQVADIQPLVANAENGGLGPGDYVILDERTMSERALTIDIPRLQELGVEVLLVTESTDSESSS